MREPDEKDEPTSTRIPPGRNMPRDHVGGRSVCQIFDLFLSKAASSS